MITKNSKFFQQLFNIGNKKIRSVSKMDTLVLRLSEKEATYAFVRRDKHQWQLHDADRIIKMQGEQESAWLGRVKKALRTVKGNAHVCLLQLAYHAMSQAMIQGKLACLRMSSQRCEEAWSPQNHVVVEQLNISMAYGYPTAFHDGIVLLAGLDNRYYRYRHEFSDLLVYPLNLPEARQRRCHIRYIQAASATQGPSMEIELSSC